MEQLHYAVISSGRPEATRTLRSFLSGVRSTWYVGNDEGILYEEYVDECDSIVEAGGLMQARNKAINDAQRAGAWSVQLSDDLYKLEHAASDVRLTVQGAAKNIVAQAISHGAHYAGVAPTANRFFYNEQRPVSTKLFIVGDFIAVSPSTPLRFDEALRLKEDYDYTLQHLHKYGKVCRCNFILASFRHRSNKGGAVSYRTPEIEQATIAYLKGKWGNHIRDNAKRPNEILLKWNGDKA